MDLGAFSRINPCGYQGLQVIDLKSLGIDANVEQIAHGLAPHLLRALHLPDETTLTSIASLP
jgi:lipoyl(octanoyl) transferase